MMGHYRAEMYETEEDWKNRHKVLTSTAEEDRAWRKKLLKSLCRKKPKKK